MVKYSVTMGVRVICVVLCLFARGWWLAVCAAGAVFLPYIAVVLANVTRVTPSAMVRPGAIVPIDRKAQEQPKPAAEGSSGVNGQDADQGDSRQWTGGDR